MGLIEVAFCCFSPAGDICAAINVAGTATAAACCCFHGRSHSGLGRVRQGPFASVSSGPLTSALSVNARVPPRDRSAACLCASRISSIDWLLLRSDCSNTWVEMRSGRWPLMLAQLKNCAFLVDWPNVLRGGLRHAWIIAVPFQLKGSMPYFILFLGAIVPETSISVVIRIRVVHSSPLPHCSSLHCRRHHTTPWIEFYALCLQKKIQSRLRGRRLILVGVCSCTTLPCDACECGLPHGLSKPPRSAIGVAFCCHESYPRIADAPHFGASTLALNA